MAYLNKAGMLWAGVPQTAGRVFWVAAGSSYTIDGATYSASDENDGLSPKRPLRRVNRAWALVTANAGDIIVLLPGTHSACTANTATAASVAANVAGVTMMGLPGTMRGNIMYPKAFLTCVAADQTVNVTAADIEIANIAFLGDALNVGSALVDFSAAANRLYVHDCTFDVTAQTANTGILGIDALGAAAHVTIERSSFTTDGVFCACIDMTGTTDSLVQDNIFNHQTGTLAAQITTGAATDRLTIRGNLFNDGAGTVTAGIDGTGATIAGGVIITRNRFGVTYTKCVANFDSGEAELSENYDSGIGATDGGVVVTGTA